jgi:hypothetical protein
MRVFLLIFLIVSCFILACTYSIRTHITRKAAKRTSLNSAAQESLTTSLSHSALVTTTASNPIRFPALESQVNNALTYITQLCDKWGLFSKGDISNYHGPEWLSFFDISKVPYLSSVSPDLHEFVINLPIYQRLLLGIASLEIIPLLIDILIFVAFYNKWNELSVSNISSGGTTDNKALQKIMSKVEKLSKTYNQTEISLFYQQNAALVFKRLYDMLFIAQPFLYGLLTDLLLDPSLQVGTEGAAAARKEKSKTRAKQLVKAITQLGPTAVKVGQAISVRPDLLSEEYLEELQTLQESVQPFDNQVAVRIIESSLSSSSGKSLTLSDIFQKSDEAFQTPVASASLGQVYLAQLKSTGEFVAVKVQRPYVKLTVTLDLYILRLLLVFGANNLPQFEQECKALVTVLDNWAGRLVIHSFIHSFIH